MAGYAFANPPYGPCACAGKIRAPKNHFPKQNQADLACPAPDAKIFIFRFSENMIISAHPVPA
jgi:hypothetical protein